MFSPSDPNAAVYPPSPCIQTLLSEIKTHLKLKVGLVQELFVQHGGVLIDGSQEDSER